MGPGSSSCWPTNGTANRFRLDTFAGVSLDLLPKARMRAFTIPRLGILAEACLAFPPGRATAGVVLPATCHQGRCLTWAGRLEKGGEVDQSDSDTYFPEDLAAGFILPCTGKPRSPLTIRTHQAEAMRRFRKEKRLPAPYS
jgi:hypothetical protein